MKTMRLLVVLSAGLLLVGGTIAILNYPARAQDSRSYLHLEPPAAPNPAAHTRQTSTAKINAVTTGEIISNTLGDGNNQIHGLIYHDGFIWASTRTSPARVLKINPDTLIVEGSVELNEGQNEGEDIVYANGYLWVVLFPTPEQLDPAQLIRVDPSAETLSADTAIVFDQVGQELTNGTTLEYAFGYLWIGGLGKVAKVDITNPLLPIYDPTYDLFDYSSLTLEDLVFFSSLESSADSLWGAMLHYSSTAGVGFTVGTVIKIDPSVPASSYITETVDALFPDDTTYINGHYYISSEDDPVSSAPSDMYKFADDLSSHTRTLVHNSNSYGTFANPLDPESIWGVYVSSPGTIKKFDLTPTEMISLTLPLNFNDPSELAFDDLGNMYAVTWQEPAGIIKYPAPIEVSDLSVNRSDLDAVLSWSHSVGNASRYQVWRSADPGFSPGDLGSAKIAEVEPPFGSTVTYTDTGVVGDLGINYTYGIKSVNDYGLVSPLSNRATLLIYPADTTTSIDSNTPNPSEFSQEVHISFSTISDIGTPTGVVTVTDGFNWCAGTVINGWCKITFITSGTRLLQATYSGDPYFNSSTSPEVTHIVNEPSEPWTYIHLPLVVR